MIVYSKVTDAPVGEPVILDEAKTHLEVSGTAKDAYITSLIVAARRICETYSGLSFITQTRSVKLDRFPVSRVWATRNLNPYSKIYLPYGPVLTVESFKYFDSEDAEQILIEDTDFVLDIHGAVASVTPFSSSWPSSVRDKANAVTIEYTAGMDADTDAGDLAIVKQAILLQVGSFFENRQDEVIGSTTSELNWNSKALLDTIKVEWNANQD